MRQPSRSTRERKRRITRRAAILAGLQMGVAGILAWRMHQLQVEQSDEYRMLAERNRINIRLLPAERGQIFDRNGAPVAVNRQNYRIIMIREQADDPARVLDDLSRLIELDSDTREKVLENISRRAAFVPVTVAERLDWDTFARVAANAPALPGIITEVGLTRAYPNLADYAHVVGYVGPVSEADLVRLGDRDPVLQIPNFPIGKTGIERIREDALRGTAGTARVEVNSAGRVMRELSREDSTPGADLQLTIDNDLQHYAQFRMQGESSAAVVMDLANGELRAMASAPSFDPTLLVHGISFNDWNTLLNDKYRPLADKSVSGAYPPGSTFKMVVALAALEAGVIDAHDRVFCPGHTDVGNRRFHCWKRGGHGRVDLVKSLSESCDVYFYDIAQRVGVDAIARMSRRFGLGERFDLPLPAISEGLVPDRMWKEVNQGRSWLIGDTVNASIGQGYVLSTPLQLAVMTARIATGRRIWPRLIARTNGLPEPAPDAPDMQIDAGHLQLIRRGMFDVNNTRQGTAYAARIAEASQAMAGKTGTSQVRQITAEEREAGVTRNEDLPWERRDHALYVGYAPFDSPRYAISIVVEHGSSGSATAAPIARDIMLRALYGTQPPLSAYPREQHEALREQRALEPVPALTLPVARSDRA